MDTKTIGNPSRTTNWAGVTLNTISQHPTMIHVHRARHTAVATDRLVHPSSAGKMVAVHLEHRDSGAELDRLVILTIGKEQDLIYIDDDQYRGTPELQRLIQDRQPILSDALQTIPKLTDGWWSARVSCLKTMAQILENGNRSCKFDLDALNTRYLSDKPLSGVEAYHPLFVRLMNGLIQANLLSVLLLETSLLPVVHQMQKVGIRADLRKLEQVCKDFGQKANDAAVELRQLLGRPKLNPVNTGGCQQLGPESCDSSFF